MLPAYAPFDPRSRAEEWWRQRESKTGDSGSFEATSGNHRKSDPDLEVHKGNESAFGEDALPAGKNSCVVIEYREAVGDMPTASTLGELARAVISKSRHEESRMLAEAVLSLLGQGRADS